MIVIALILGVYTFFCGNPIQDSSDYLMDLSLSSKFIYLMPILGPIILRMSLGLMFHSLMNSSHQASLASLQSERSVLLSLGALSISAFFAILLKYDSSSTQTQLVYPLFFFLWATISHIAGFLISSYKSTILVLLLSFATYDVGRFCLSAGMVFLLLSIIQNSLWIWFTVYVIFALVLLDYYIRLNKCFKALKHLKTNNH
tara:strand:+ start:2167 stop:2769 length:603 start_codon:yes stop_codon:yes gene_type:complete